MNKKLRISCQLSLSMNFNSQKTISAGEKSDITILVTCIA